MNGQTPERAAEYLRPHGGKVLFYDEANAFDSAGEYAKAAATEIIRFLNEHEGKVCMIVAGERGGTASHRPHAAQSTRGGSACERIGSRGELTMSPPPARPPS